MKTVHAIALAALFGAAAICSIVAVRPGHGEDDAPAAAQAPPKESSEGDSAKEPNADPLGRPPNARLSTELHAFMRKKLNASEKILEGLVTEDAELIKEGASDLNVMSSAEKWRISRDMMYARFSEDFRNVTKELIDAADAGSIDRAALKWMDVTMSCLDCHRFVRSHLVAGVPPGVRPGVPTDDAPEADAAK